MIVQDFDNRSIPVPVRYRIIFKIYIHIPVRYRILLKVYIVTHTSMVSKKRFEYNTGSHLVGIDVRVATYPQV